MLQLPLLQVLSDGAVRFQAVSVELFAQADIQQHTCQLQVLGIYADYYIFETTLKEQADEEETVGECQHTHLQLGD